MDVLKSRREVPRGRPVYIFGTGRGGLLLLTDFKRDAGIRIAGFIDNFKTGAIDGLPVLSPAAFFDQETDEAYVVIGSSYYQEIRSQLAAAGFRGYVNGYPYVLYLIDRQVLVRNLLITAAVIAAIAAAGWALLG